MLSAVPEVVLSSEPELAEFSRFAWSLAYDHVTNCTGAVQSPYMDEAFYADRIWVWDSCFMVNYCKYAPQLFPGVESLANFYVPMLEGKKTPLSIHIPDNPPLFAWVEWMYYRQTGDKARLDRIFREKRYPQRMFELFENFRTGDRTRYQTSAFPVMWEKRELGYVWTGGRSGMDNTPRGDFPPDVMDNDARYLTILWIDAIAQQALAARIIHEVTGEALWKERFESLAKTINDHYWDETDGCYYDIRSYSSHDKVKVMTPASFWPLLAGVVPADRVTRLVRHLEDERELGGVVPFPSVARNSRHFNPTGAYWRGGVWLPMAFMCVQALEENGYGALADRLGEQVVRWQYETYKTVRPHTIWEAYSPTEPKPATGKVTAGPNADEGARPDFCGWSALGPINLMIENVVGIRCDAPNNLIRWRVRRRDRHGVRRLRLGAVEVSLIYEDGKIDVQASGPFRLEINGRSFNVSKGDSTVRVDARPDFDIRKFGAHPDALASANADAIQKAVDAASAVHGRVVVPAGEWVSGTIWLKSHVTIHLEQGAVLKASTDLADYNAEDAYPENYGCKTEYWRGLHFIICRECEDVAITGRGTIHGNGNVFFEDRPGFYDWMKNAHCWPDGVRWAKDKVNLRPGQLVVFVKCHKVRVEGVTIAQSPCWSLFFHGCRDVVVRDYTVRNGPCDANTDGIDVDCCQNVLLEDLDIRTGDDAIAIRASGRRLGLDPALPCENVTVRRARLDSSANVFRIGVGDGVIRNVTVEDVTSKRGGTAVKLNAGFGDLKKCGVDMEHLVFRRCRFENCSAAYYIHAAGEKLTFGIRDVLFEDVAFPEGADRHVGAEAGSPEPVGVRMR